MLLASSVSGARNPAPITLHLWPEGAPGEKATAGAEHDTTTAKDALVAGKPVIRLGNVGDPTLTVYRPLRPDTAHSAVLVFPGGGYYILAMDLEGTEVCHWLNSLGIAAVLVKYRVPQPKNLPRYAQPFEDAERALTLVRSHAGEWGIDRERVGVLGFSAGAHLAAVLNSAATNGQRPNFVLLIYPAYLSVNDEGERLAPEVAVSGQTAPTFLVQTEDDHKFVGGDLLYYRALEHANIPAEMHLYAQGGHGYGLRPAGDAVTEWPKLAERWLRGQHLLAK